MLRNTYKTSSMQRTGVTLCAACRSDEHRYHNNSGVIAEFKPFENCRSHPFPFSPPGPHSSSSNTRKGEMVCSDRVCGFISSASLILNASKRNSCGTFNLLIQLSLTTDRCPPLKRKRQERVFRPAFASDMLGLVILAWQRRCVEP